MNKYKKILAIPNESSSFLWRFMPYFKYANLEGFDALCLEPERKTIPNHLLKEADIVILEMSANYQLVRDLQKQGKKVIYDIDDLLEWISKTHPKRDTLSVLGIYKFFQTMRASDAVFCSVEKLKKRYRFLNKNTYVIPNYLDLDFWEKPYKKNISSKIRIGWAGGMSHADDLEFIAPVIRDICKKYPQVKFVNVFGGGSPAGSAYGQYLYGKDVFLIPAEQREYYMGVHYFEYPTFLANLGLDIGLAPVVDNRFSRYKSNIKWLEYGINKIPCIGSSNLYAGSINNFVDGVVVNNTYHGWFRAIEGLINRPDERHRIGTNAYLRAKRDFNAENYYENYFNVIKNL